MCKRGFPQGARGWGGEESKSEACPPLPMQVSTSAMIGRSRRPSRSFLLPYLVRAGSQVRKLRSEPGCPHSSPPGPGPRGSELLT